MTREVEMNKAFKLYKEEREKADALPFYDLWEGFKAGFKYADSHPQYFRGQTDEMMEHEAAFAKDWLKEHRGEKPCYADAIAWAEKKMIARACKWLNEELRNYAPFYDVVDRGRFIDKLRNWLEE